MPREVTAFSNTTVKRLRSLRDKKGRRSEGLFLAEGLRIIAEARDSGLLPQIVAFSPDGARHPLAAEIIAATEAAGGEAIETTPFENIGRVTLSAGVCSTEHASGADALMHNAERALYWAKDSGRNMTMLYTDETPDRATAARNTAPGATD